MHSDQCAPPAPVRPLRGALDLDRDARREGDREALAVAASWGASLSTSLTPSHRPRAMPKLTEVSRLIRKVALTRISFRGMEALANRSARVISTSS